MKQNLDYRQWPNVLAINAKIDALEQKLSQTESENVRMNLRRELHSLVSKKYDQIQFNKEMARKETA
ncbi:MAG: hypothetical protein HC840_00530 [Leptolyngbyaceae cyanobacterium RM2_2_4]|nr:hypothetical protein [Leptolyngbyaceae cyanobacterium RM2_2_4]